jgi:hypothetical protein
VRPCNQLRVRIILTFEKQCYQGYLDVSANWEALISALGEELHMSSEMLGLTDLMQNPPYASPADYMIDIQKNQSLGTGEITDWLDGLEYYAASIATGKGVFSLDVLTRP